MALANRAFGFTEEAAVAFHDVREEDWFAPVVGRAVAAGYIQGNEDGSVKPLQEVRRQETALMLHRILELEPGPWSSADFTDADAIADWSRGAVGALVERGILSGYPDGSFRPDGGVTRAEAVTLLDRAVREAHAEPIVLGRAGQTFGPETGLRRIGGDVIVAAPDIVLRNLVIEGDLVIADEVGEGEAELRQVEVRGVMMVHGGGSESIHLYDSNAVRLVIDKPNGAVRIVAAGNTVITETAVYSSAKLEAAEDVEGEAFLSVTWSSGETELWIVRALIGQLHVTEDVVGSVLYLADGGRVIELVNLGSIQIVEVGVPDGSAGSGKGTDPGEGEPEPGSGDGPGMPEPTVTALTYAPESLVLVGIGDSSAIVLHALWSDGRLTNAAPEAEWRSDDPDVASVDGGTVVAQGKGETVVRAEFGGFAAAIPVAVVESAARLEMTVSDSAPAAGEAVSVTIAVYRSDGKPDIGFAGPRTVAISGYSFAPDGTAGFFAGEKLEGTSTDVDIPFDKGVGSAQLILHHAVPQAVEADLAGAEHVSDTAAVEPGHGLLAQLSFLHSPEASVEELELFTAVLQLSDPYGNLYLAPATVTADVYAPGTGGARLAGGAASAVSADGLATFENLALRGAGGGVRLQFAAGAVSLISPPMTVISLYAGGEGTVESPYELASAEQLLRVRDHLDAHFVLAGPIELPSLEAGEEGCGGLAEADGCLSYVANGGWTPIGTEDEPFTGSFDGGGYPISNLTIARHEDYQGLFGHVFGGRIENLKLTDASVDTSTDDSAGKSYVGLLAGKLDGGSQVVNVEVSGRAAGSLNVGGLLGFLGGTVTGATADVEVSGGNHTGGLIGENYGTVTGSRAVGKVTGSSHTGGLIGYNREEGIVTHSSSAASVDVPGTNQNNGGLIGSNDGTIAYSYATGPVSSGSHSGGLVGENSGEVIYAYATGDVNTSFYAGGLVSYNGTTGSVSYAYATGEVPDRDGFGGLMSLNHGTIHHAYYFRLPDNGYGARLTADDIKRRSEFIHWTFAGDSGLEEEPVWIINDNVQTPQLLWEYEAPGTDAGLTLTEAVPSVPALSLHVGETVMVGLTGSWSDGTTGDDVTSAAMWHSARSSTATVTGGLVTAVNAGSTVVKAVLGGIVVEIPVEVVTD